MYWFELWLDAHSAPSPDSDVVAQPFIDDIVLLIPSWVLSLRSDGKSPATIKSYVDGVNSYVAYCDRNGHAHALDRRQGQAWVAALMEEGRSPATAVARQLGVRRFTAWATKGGRAGFGVLTAALTEAGAFASTRRISRW